MTDMCIWHRPKHLPSRSRCLATCAYSVCLFHKVGWPKMDFSVTESFSWMFFDWKFCNFKYDVFFLHNLAYFQTNALLALKCFTVFNLECMTVRLISTAVQRCLNGIHKTLLPFAVIALHYCCDFSVEPAILCKYVY